MLLSQSVGVNIGMARPKPKILASNSRTTYPWEYQVIEEKPEIFVLTYKGEVVSTRQVHLFDEWMKYPRSVFHKEGAANRKANDMNKHFNCNDFSYKEIIL